MNMQIHSQRSPLTERFAHICRILHMVHHHEHRKHGPMADPHRGQGRVLALLLLQPEITQKDLSFLLDIRPQSLGELLAKLEKSGYIVRTPSETDNRVAVIRLTEEGKNASKNPAENESGLFDGLNAEEQEVLAGYLDRVIAGMEEKLGDTLPSFHPSLDPRFRHGSGQNRGCCRHDHADEGDAGEHHHHHHFHSRAGRYRPDGHDDHFHHGHDFNQESPADMEE